MSITCAAPVETAAVPAGWLDPWFRRRLLDRLRGVCGGQITVSDASASDVLGTASELQTHVRVRNPRFYRHALLGGSLSVAESYLRNDWDCDQLVNLFRIFLRSRDAFLRMDQGLSRLLAPAHRLYHQWHANTRTGSRRNIAAHYDLGNDFFELMLDETMAYSSGYFATPHSLLRDASVEKFDRVCRQLNLQPGDHLLEIGTGWGGFAIHAASNYGCRVTTTTISQQQHNFARQRIAAAGLGDRVTLLLEDYRDLTGTYDKLASIEMIEAVGHRYYDTFFAQCSRLLKPDGSLVIQAILAPDAGYDTYLRSVDFVQRYVFPGGCLPSLGAMLQSTGRVTDFRLVQLDEFGLHYARTLREWRRRFHDRLDDVRRLGYPPRFVRLWDYYLCYCEAAFEERHTTVAQLQFDKPRRRREAV